VQQLTADPFARSGVELGRTAEELPDRQAE
jgi:hypothetical protein